MIRYLTASHLRHTYHATAACSLVSSHSCRIKMLYKTFAQIQSKQVPCSVGENSVHILDRYFVWIGCCAWFHPRSYQILKFGWISLNMGYFQAFFADIIATTRLPTLLYIFFFITAMLYQLYYEPSVHHYGSLTIVVTSLFFILFTSFQFCLLKML